MDRSLTRKGEMLTSSHLGFKMGSPRLAKHFLPFFAASDFGVTKRVTPTPDIKSVRRATH